jgi:hypothetical protein
MRRRFSWPLVLGLALVLSALSASQGRAAEAEKKAGATAGLVGAIVAFIPESQTLVVDVPLSADVLRIGARLTSATRITAAGKPASSESLKVGSWVRLDFRRVADGNEALSVEVLRSPKS